MSSPEAKALAARKKALRAELAQRRSAAQAELDRRRRVAAGAAGGAVKKKDRRWVWVLLAIVALLLLLLSDCTCAPEVVEGVAEVPVVVEAEAVGDVALAEPEKKKAPPLRMPRQDRPEYVSEVPEALPWVAAFQLQVEARSARLAACFVGADRPGRLKWTAAMAPVDGRVSEHTLEPTVAEEVLTKQQKTCVIGVLSEPPYRLDVGEGKRATPSRVGMVIEF